MEKIIDCETENIFIDSSKSLNAAICLMYELNTSKILFVHSNLHENFFKLRTGLAGEIIQMLKNYQIRAAFVLSPEKLKAGKFGEMIAEESKGEQIKAFVNRQEAEEWLCRD